jgi:hypothetical protein
VSVVNPRESIRAGAGEGEDGADADAATAAAMADIPADALNRFTQQRAEQKAAMQVIKELHMASNAENAVYTPFPPEILDQMRTCHNAASEFLRQYWSAVLPAPAAASGAAGGAGAGGAQGEMGRAAKAERMAGYLRSTGEKVEAVVQTAGLMGVDAARVRAVSLAGWCGVRGACGARRGWWLGTGQYGAVLGGKERCGAVRRAGGDMGKARHRVPKRF